jgi:integrase
MSEMNDAKDVSEVAYVGRGSSGSEQMKWPSEGMKWPPKFRREELTDKGVAKIARTAAQPGTRYIVMDTWVSKFGIRVTDKPHATYILAGRFPGSKNFTRREIAAVGAISLARARERAKEWIELIRLGKDPKLEEQRQRDEQIRSEARKRAITFEMVAEAFIEDRVIGSNPERPILRQGKWRANVIRNQFIRKWGNRPITDITRDDVLAVIREKKKSSPESARTQLANIKSLLSWALDQSYGLDRNVASDIKPASVIGDKNPRDRVLNDNELRALWAVADNWNYPVGPLYKMLMLTGLRLNEVARASWSEFDLAKREWTIPASRMKGKNTGSDGRKAKPHLVPLSQAMIDVLDNLPRFENGDYLFSTTFGAKPVNVGMKIKNSVDAKMLEQLRRDDAKAVLPPFVNHDIRRTVRTNLSRLKVSEAVAEAVLAHVRPGIVAIYNLHSYATEKREALELWAASLREIVAPPQPEPGKVVRLKRKARR